MKAAPGEGPATLERAREVFRAEVRLLEQVAESLGESFEKTVDCIFQCRGIVFVTGVGKSGIIGRKIAATFASTGTRAAFIHPVEAAHGDMGIIREEDLVLVLSKSGESLEIAPLLTAAKKRGVRVIAVAGSATGTLAAAADIALVIPVEPEACPMNLAPTSSTTAMLCLGDALALVVLEKRGFREEHFASLHPAGDLGRRLLLKVVRVSEIMHAGDKNPVVSHEATMSEAVRVLTEKRLGGVNVVDGEGRLAGIIVDGDLKRGLVRFGDDLLRQPARSVMTAEPTVIRSEALAAEAVHLLEDRPFQISVLPVVDGDGRAVGLLRMHDLVKAGLA